MILLADSSGETKPILSQILIYSRGSKVIAAKSIELSIITFPGIGTLINEQ
jgi:hypothetical protein